MSNNNPAKPAMAEIVSAAQKSVNNGNNNNTQKSTAHNLVNISNKNVAPLKEDSKEHEKNLKTTLHNVTKTTEDIIKSATETLKETIQKQEKSIPESKLESGNLNHHMVSILCDGIRNIHNQSLDFAEKIRQKREQKIKSLSEIQTITCDNIYAASNACIEAAHLSLKSKNPIDIIQKQAKAATTVHQLYTTMFANISKTSMDILKHNMSSCYWLNNNKK